MKFWKFSLLIVTYLASVSGTVIAGENIASGPDILAHCFVPSDARRHGEVRLLASPGSVSVETIFFSASLRRGLQAIEKKEAEAWPVNSEGYTDSLHYLTALEKAATRLLSTASPSTLTLDVNAPVKAGSRIRKMIIRLTRTAASAEIIIGSAEFIIPEGAGPIRSVEITPLETVSVKVNYARESMQQMLEAATKKSGDEIKTLLVDADGHARLTKD